MYDKDEISQETLNEWQRDPDNWLWGFLYYNLKDKRLFVLKRTFFGITINFANPKASLFFGALIAVIVIIAVIGKN